MELIAHTCNAKYIEGYAILKLDSTNGFQEIRRSQMHRAILDRCPSLLNLFQRYYTKESVCFFNMDDGVRLLTAHEGARIGCKLSSFAFGLTAANAYQDVSKMISCDGGSCVKAAILMIV